MKKLIGITLLSLVAVLSAFGQATITSTTLSSAISASDLLFNVASATGISNANGANYVTILFIDKELMGVASVSGTTVTIGNRGLQGTGQGAHASGAKVFLGPPSYFGYGDPTGGCTSTSLIATPYLATLTGNLWSCSNSKWTSFGTIAGKAVVGAVVASATTIAPTAPAFHVSGTTAVVNITVPAACPSLATCVLTLIPDGIFTTTTAGNIALASTAVVSKALIMTWDPVAAKWYPSY